MADRLDDIIAHRTAKMHALRAASQEPYPSVTTRTHTIAAALDKFDELASSSEVVTVVGRLRSSRLMGKVAFGHLEDATGRIQLVIKEDHTVADSFQNFFDNYDVGDFLQATGTLMTTKTGERSVAVTELKILSKSLRPLPTEHFGLQDSETKLRQRYLDILLDPEVKDLFIKKNTFWQTMRQFLIQDGYLEMDMPILEATPGGAEAEPFITHHNALDQDFFLRISLELPLKRMLVAGYEKVFEIGRIFRNEGISPTHLQDYTQMEFYWAYGDFAGLQDLVRRMYQSVISATCGSLQVTSGGVTCDWSGEWERVDYIKLFHSHTGLDLLTCSDQDLRDYAEAQHLKPEAFEARGRLIDRIFKNVRKSIPTDRPIFLINQPIELEPLAKREPANASLVQRFQIIAYGTELGKGFGELNDPVDQRGRFAEQMALRAAGDAEAQMLDEDFVEALEYGMPPAAGFGLSERLFSVLMDRPVRECVVFPPMRRKS